MVKSVFVDYTGTLVADMDQNTLEVAENLETAALKALRP